MALTRTPAQRIEAPQHWPALGSQDERGDQLQAKLLLGCDALVMGRRTYSHALLAAGLLDRLVLWIHPFLIGRGGPQDLLYRDNELTTFELVDVTQLESQIVVLGYELSPK